MDHVAEWETEKLKMYGILTSPEAVYEKMNEGKCFSFFNIRKTLFFINVIFFSLTGIQFSLTIFLYCCQTWKNKESEFQEFTFLQSNTPIV
jgi:hypothetical protein